MIIWSLGNKLLNEVIKWWNTETWSVLELYKDIDDI